MHWTTQESSKPEPAKSCGEQFDARSAGSAGQDPAEPAPEAQCDPAIAQGGDGLEDVAYWPYWV